MPLLTLHDWLNWLEHRKPNAKTVFHLDNVKTIATGLNLLPVTKPVISVTGTNGKGSCTAFCEAILKSAGYRVGAYYSPHLFVFNERIRIDGCYASDSDIIKAFSIIKKTQKIYQYSLSYFEFATLAALYIFKAKNVDVLVLEAGIGGRLDTINIVDSDVAVITSISKDHVHWLGKTRDKIGREKAGIFRQNKPAVIAEKNIPNSVRCYAEETGSPLLIYKKSYHYKKYKSHWTWWGEGRQYFHLPLPQLLVKNAATALQVLAVLPSSLPVSEAAIRQGLLTAWLPGRLQCFKTAITQIFDVAHNPASASLLAKYLKKYPVSGKTYAIVGMLNDKLITQTLKPLTNIVVEWYAASLPGSRGLSAKALSDALLISGCSADSITCLESVKQAYKIVLSRALPGDRLIVFGSFHTVGEICPVNV